MLNRRRFVGARRRKPRRAVHHLVPRAAGIDWPAKPVRIVVPFTPGGSTDITARLVGNRLQEVWGQTVVVENKGGAGGNIAADMVAKSDPDGYTIFIVGPGMATNKFLYPSLSYDPVGDFAPVTHADHPAQHDVRAEHFAGEIGAGVHRLSATRTRARSPMPRPATAPRCICRGELFKRLAKVEMTHIPYRGGAPAINDLIPGRVDVIFDNMPSIIVACPAAAMCAARGDDQGARRHRARRADDRGERVPGFDVFSWFGFFVPAKTPPEVIAKLNADTNAALAYPAVKSRFEDLGAVPKGSTPERTGRLPAIRDRQMGPGDHGSEDQAGELRHGEPMPATLTRHELADSATISLILQGPAAA